MNQHIRHNLSLVRWIDIEIFVDDPSKGKRRIWHNNGWI